MGARELLKDLAGAGLSVITDGDWLLIRPASKLTDDLRSALRAAKPELLLLLGSERNSPQEIRSARVRARLLRWGRTAIEADAMADRLARRDAVGDARVCCAGDCTHYRLGRCGNHAVAGLHSPDVGRDLAELLQCCPGYVGEGR
jgi:TubC N-terminal docking domain